MTGPAQGYDVIVVGGGTAGCVIAGRLAEDPNRRILLIEAGPRKRDALIATPGASAFAASRKATNWNVVTQPQQALGGRALYLSQARLLGGGSAINGMVYTRGAAADYDDWRDAGAAGWGYADVLRWFRKSEDSARGAGPYHGVGGPMRVEPGASPLPIAQAFLAAAQQAGFPLTDDLNLPAAEGIGPYDWMVGRGRRVSTASAFLPRGHAPNLTIVAGAQATRIRIAKGRAVGVDYVQGGVPHSADADGEVVLAGGALRSPQLLMLSGIGPTQALAAAGVSPLHDLPQVGRNLRNHLSYKIALPCDAPVSAYRYFQGLNGPLELLRYATGRRGFLANASAPAGGFFRSSEAVDRPDMQLFMLPVLTGGLGGGLRALLPNAHGMTLFINQGRPYSSGTLTLSSADPLAPPRIDPAYFSDPRDLPLLVDAIARVRRIASAPAFAALGGREMLPGPDIHSREDLIADIRARAGNHFHVAGTCRIGTDPAASVVDPALRVHGLDGLRVADASVMPTLVNANTAAPVIMIAERAAAMIAG